MTNENQLCVWNDETNIVQIRQIFAPTLTSGEFDAFMQMGKATGLNPFLKEIWAVKYGNSPAQIFVGRDGYRKSAQRNPLYDYHTVDAVYSNDNFEVCSGDVKHSYGMKDRGVLVGAYCMVQRKGSSRAAYVFVDMKEYNKGQSVWKEKPATMIKKVAEAQGLRMAFQELFSGTYDEAEAWNDKQRQVDIPVKKTTTASTPALEAIEVYTVDQVKDKIEMAKTKRDLAKAAQMAQTLTAEEKNEVRELYNTKKLTVEDTA